MINAAPPSYGASTAQHAATLPGLDFVDIIPACIDNGIFSRKYEPFSVLVQRANQYLSGNPQLEVKTCESVEFYMTMGEPELQHMVHRESKDITYQIRALRLWVVTRSDPSRPPQQIGYFNVVPRALDSGILNPRFDSLDGTLQVVNEMLKNQPLAGRILNMETQDMKYTSINPIEFDPDKTLWKERDDRGLLSVNVLRIFYELGSPAYELLGCIDFVPDILQGGLLGLNLAPFSTLVKKAADWCAQMQNGRYCNAQTLECQYRAGIGSTGVIDSKKMYNYEYSLSMQYVKFLRLVYCYPFVENAAVPPPLILSSKTFIPMQLSGSVFMPTFENAGQVRQKMQTWINAIGGKVISAETVPYKLTHGWSDVTDLTSIHITRLNPTYMKAIRVYFDGVYQEPQVVYVYPQLPAGTSSSTDCCSIL